MKKWLLIALLPGAFFASGLNAQTLRLDFGLSAGTDFSAEMEKRENVDSLLAGQFNGKWKTSEGLSFGPLGFGYLHKVGEGRIYVGASYSQYKYSASHTDMGIGFINMSTVDKYDYSMLDAEGGYEFKVGKIALTPKIGRRSYDKNYESSDFSMLTVLGFAGFGTNDRKLDASSSGLYAALRAEMEVNKKLTLFLDGAKSMGPMTGTADMGNGSRSFIGTLMLTSRTTSMMDSEVDFTSLKIGARIMAFKDFYINLGIQQDEFVTSYPGRFDVTVAMAGSSAAIGTSLNNIPNWFLTQALWGKTYSDRRTAVFYGFTKEYNF